MKPVSKLTQIIFVSLLIQACATVPNVSETPNGSNQQNIPVANPPIGKCLKNTWRYDSLVLSKLTSTILAANVSSFCPNAKKLDAKTVWLNIVKAIAYAESGWNPEEQYTEKSMGIDPVTGKQVVSEGLLQMSYQDSRNWSSLPLCKAIDYTKKNITDPVLNLSCGMEIMDRLAGRDTSLDISNTKSLGAYWSTVRAGHNASRTKLRALMPECFS